jgi:hypothetical protein
MAQTIHKTEQPVVLEGFQAVLKPGKFGYKLSALLDQDTINTLEDERTELLKWAESKLKNPKRSTLKPEPRPPVVDTEGTIITDEDTPLYGGSKVKLAFRQKPYILKDGVTYGTSLKLAGIQVIALNTSAGVDTGDMDDASVAELFGKTAGFKASDPNVTPSADVVEDDDF